MPLIYWPRMGLYFCRFNVIAWLIKNIETKIIETLKNEIASLHHQVQQYSFFFFFQTKTLNLLWIKTGNSQTKKLTRHCYQDYCYCSFAKEEKDFLLKWRKMFDRFFVLSNGHFKKLFRSKFHSAHGLVLQFSIQDYTLTIYVRLPNNYWLLRFPQPAEVNCVFEQLNLTPSPLIAFSDTFHTARSVLSKRSPPHPRLEYWSLEVVAENLATRV